MDRWVSFGEQQTHEEKQPQLRKGAPQGVVYLSQLEEAKRLIDVIEKRQKGLSIRWGRDSTEQRDRATDRRTLAELFDVMAVRLRGKDEAGK